MGPVPVPLQRAVTGDGGENQQIPDPLQLFRVGIYPDAITDPDLLEQALEILDSAADLLNTPEELGLDLSEAPFTSPRRHPVSLPHGRTPRPFQRV